MMPFLFLKIQSDQISLRKPQTHQKGPQGARTARIKYKLTHEGFIYFNLTLLYLIIWPEISL